MKLWTTLAPPLTLVHFWRISTLCGSFEDTQMIYRYFIVAAPNSRYFYKVLSNGNPFMRVFFFKSALSTPLLHRTKKTLIGLTDDPKVRVRPHDCGHYRYSRISGGS